MSKTNAKHPLSPAKDAVAMPHALTKTPVTRTPILRALAPCLLATFIALSGVSAHADGAGASAFGTPEQAVDAFAAAARANDAPALVRIFGPDGQRIVDSGDAVADREARARFVTRYGQGHKIEAGGDSKAVLVIGTEEWPFPIPLVRSAAGWQFDAAAGAEEILNRRIGRNELNAIEVCRALVQAQRDYAAAERQPGQPRAEYAQRFISSPGQHDGLYWPATPGEAESPIGPLLASARAEGYGKPDDGGDAAEHAPYHGYRYAILMRQGPSAPGGAHDYIVDGHMVGGFGLIAFPATYGDSGVKTFIVSQDGIVYQKDLGPDTATIAPSITAFDPDKSWRMP